LRQRPGRYHEDDESERADESQLHCLIYYKCSEQVTSRDPQLLLHQFHCCFEAETVKPIQPISTALNVLIIGGTGFIGGCIARRLSGHGNNVALFHRGRTKTTLPAVAASIQGDRQQLNEFAPAFRSLDPEVVIDTCAYSERDAELAVKTFSGIADRLVCLSSMDVYEAYGIFRRLEEAKPDPMPFSEEAPLRSTLYPYRSSAASPDDFLFSYEKILVEEIVMNEPRLPAIVLRLPQVFGPNDSQHRLADYLRRMDAAQPVVIDEVRARWRWTRAYVEDVAFAVELAATNRKNASRIYNVGEPTAPTEVEWIEKIGAAAGWSGEIDVRHDSAAGAADSYDWSQDLTADTSRIRAELGYHETVSLDEALRRSVGWERTQRG
jgi:nucleoside-diphosphate-sugar epimerase